MTTSRPPLVLTGGPAVGKTTTADRLAARLDRSVVIDVDDLRQLVRSGHAAPWQGPDGLVQQRLGVQNACDLGRRLDGAGFAVIIADVLTAETLLLYRRLLPGCVVLRLVVTPEEADARARSRPVYLSADEFRSLHAADRADPVAADVHLDVTTLDPDEQLDAVLSAWSASGPSRGPATSAGT